VSWQVAALGRSVEALRKRLEASKQENEQLEDMLARAEVRARLGRHRLGDGWAASEGLAVALA
jgi:hypothetical protein